MIAYLYGVWYAFIIFYRTISMNTPRTTFHLPRELYTGMSVGDTVELKFSDDAQKEYQNARNQTYRFNMWLNPMKFSLTKKEKKGYLIIKRVK